MIYWNTTPGAAFDISVPNQFGLQPQEGAALRFEVLNNVGRAVYPSGVFNIDAVTPAWMVLHFSNDEEITDYPPAGEYTYRAYLVVAGEPDRLLSEGIMIFGDYTADRQQYDNTIQYEQYDNA